MKLDTNQEEDNHRSSVITDGRAAEQSYIQSSFDAKNEEEKKSSKHSSSNEALSTSLFKEDNIFEHDSTPQ